MKIDYVKYIDKFKGYNILVIGDFILDAYFHGGSTRLAPEAPVPVVDVHSKKYCLGGAANSAANLRALGCKVQFCTVIGKDDSGKKGLTHMTNAGLSTAPVIADPTRNTLIKTRVTAGAQTIVRFDEGTDTSITASTEKDLIQKICKAYMDCDAVLIADYDKGVVTGNVIAALMALKRNIPKFIAVDSKRINVFACLEPSLIKPNYEEAVKILSMPLQNEGHVDQVSCIGEQLHQVSKAVITALTLDREGVVFFEKGAFSHYQPAPPVTIKNVSGAGDTFISTCLLALISDMKIQETAVLASVSAGIAIQKEQTAICRYEELCAFFILNQKHIKSNNQIKSLCKWYKTQGKRIVFTNGCFDILHSGHVNYLNQSKQMGDVLIVGLNNDESIRRLKGKSRPINLLYNRIEVLGAMDCVDHIISFGSVNDDTPVNLIKLIEPDLFVKGGDYKNTILPESAILQQLGCKVAFLPFVPKQSTTQMISRMDDNMKLKISFFN